MLVEKISIEEIANICQILASEVKAKAEILIVQMPRREDTAWTLAVKATLEEIGSKKGYESLYSNREKGNHEFLLDLVWWDRRDGFDAAALACECELGNKRDELHNPLRVEEDFDKLLSFKAPLKLMIFDSYGTKAGSQNTVDQIITALNGYLQRYRIHIAGETYLLWDCSDESKFWKCDITMNGIDSTLGFEPFS
jgi:hypothetical protein